MLLIVWIAVANHVFPRLTQEDGNFQTLVLEGWHPIVFSRMRKLDNNQTIA